MGRRKKGDDSPKTGTIRLPAELVRRLGIISSDTGETVMDIATRLLQADVDRLYAESARRISKDVEGDAAKKGGK